MDSPIVPTIDILTQEAASDGVVVPISKTYKFSDFEDSSPLSAFLKIRRGSHSILWECSLESDPLKLSYSVIGTEPFKIINCGTQDGQSKGNPLTSIEEETKKFTIPKKYQLDPPILNGAAFGYIGYDAVKYFEPKVAPILEKQIDALQIPEAVTLMLNSFVFFDHISSTIKIVALCPLNDLQNSYQKAVQRINELEQRFRAKEYQDFVNGDVTPHETVSNAGPDGYHKYVRSLRENIIGGDVIQAVPSQRLAKKTGIHPWNIYKRLRQINPSRYGFYLEIEDFNILGLSPELLVKVINNQITTHPIAGTRKRGKTPEEDDALAAELLADEKERAEHIMLVDLGRNDVNRAAIPETTKVTSLMHIEKFSHVMHIVSWVTGQLRPECTPFDAFRSIFPAGTVSGAPKIRAIELVGALEKEKRGAYAGTVGYFSFCGNIDTCIAIRTLVAKAGFVYFQAGGGIVFDSEENFENEETLTKMGALTSTVAALEKEASGKPISEQKNPKISVSEESQQYHKLFQFPAPSKELTNQKANSASNQKPVTLMIDNYDSFTWNLYQYLSQLGEHVIVYRNDQVTVEECLALNPGRVVLSPGPGDPSDAGVCGAVLKAFMGKVPILGVCLGHEVLVHEMGGEIISAGEMKHGKTSSINHDKKGLYAGISEPFEVIRYHSLTANPAKIPDTLEVVSSTANGIIMGVRHKVYAVEGVQYHPESIKTEHGLTLLKNFLNWTSPTWA